MVILLLAFFGLSLGSFVNALVWRVKQSELKAESRKTRAKKDDKLSILSGRSMCPHCRHELAARDLVPVISWLGLRGRCRYCKKPISWQYPLVELATVAVFVTSYIFWPGGVNTAGDWLLFITWLLVSVGLLALLVYDLKWMLLPNKIIYPTLAIAVTGKFTHMLIYEIDKIEALISLLLSVLIASGIFFVIFIISSGRWIGYGDVRLGLITGTVLAEPDKSLLMIFMASVLGTLYVLPAIILKRQELHAMLPYGPFLITATAVSLLFGHSIINCYKTLFLI